MKREQIKAARRERRRMGLAKRIRGTSERPRLTVFRSVKNIYAQIVNDEEGRTICEASSMSKEIRSRLKHGGNIDAAKVVGTLLAERAKAKSVDAVCFDRSGYKFHGRLKALADAAREAGLKF